jgi:capsular polysaccharide transport system permease protein
MGLGLGLMCCALKRYSESVQVVVSMVLRIGIFTSGVMFSFSRLPHELMFLVRMNPILQLIEYSRTSFSYTYQGGKFINFPLVLITTLVVLFLGTFLEIATRNKRDVV